MYLKTKLIGILKMKNRILFFLAVVFICLPTADIVSLCFYYWGDWDTVLHAKSTPDSVCAIILGLLLLWDCLFSGKAIWKASFYSSYFECDLDGSISFDELSAVVGRSVGSIRRELHFLRIFYMKNFRFRTEGQQETIELYSKKVLCRCRNCGAFIDKKIYFTGVCPFCKTSDIFASVLTDHQIYNITSDFGQVKHNPDFYKCKSLGFRKVLYTIGLIISAIFFLLLMMVLLDSISSYNDQEYLTKLLLSGESYSSYELIKKSIIDSIIWNIFFLLVLVPFIILSIHRLRLLKLSVFYANAFAASSAPFIHIEELPGNMVSEKKTISHIQKIIQTRYLRNCSIECHDDRLQVTLAKKVVKDKCPYCGAPITGAVSENYTCEFCNNAIMQVIDIK